MAYTYNDDVYGVALDVWTPTQFRDKVVYQALLKAMTAEVQKLEDLAKQMYSERSINTAVGAQLDNVGANMGVDRMLGWTDAQYRTAIYAEIFMRRSDGSANYIMGALKSLYQSPTAMIFEHNTAMTGGVVVKVNQPAYVESAISVLKKMSPATIQSVVILRDVTPKGYAWTPAEVTASTSALVTQNNDWFITNGGLGIVVQSGSGSAVKNMIGTLGEPGLQTTPLSVEQKVSPPEASLAIDAKQDQGNLLVDKYASIGGEYGIMAEVSQLRRGSTIIEGEK